MYPRDFRIKLFISNFRIDSLFGTVDENGTLYVSSHDVGCILRKTDPYTWGENKRTCRYQDISIQGKDSKRGQCPMIERFKLLTLLQPLVDKRKEAGWLYQLLLGTLKVQYEKMRTKEHVLTCCRCAFYNGTRFHMWVRHHNINSFCIKPLRTTPRPNWNFYHAGVKYAPDFRIKLYLSKDEVDSLFGTISREGVVYYSSYNIAMFLHKRNPMQWCDNIKTCYYQDIEFEENPKRKKFKMISSEALMTLLKEEKDSPTEAKYIEDLLRGKRNVKYEDIIYREHIMNCCNCGQFYGIPFNDWLWIHKANLLQYESTHSPKTKV